MMTRSAAMLARAALFAGALSALPAAARAAEVAGVALPPTETVQGRQLQLASCAAREELWMELYALSLYLPPGTPTDPARILDDGTAKLLRLDVTYDGRVPNGLPEDWAGRLRDEVSREFMRTLRDQYNDLKGGDTVRISYVPGRGTALTVNGRAVTTRPGGELMASMLELWIGRDPVSGNVKRLLLSGAC